MKLAHLKYGALAGLAGGLLFGMMMGMMGALPMIGRMVGLPTVAGGFLVHMLISAAIGVGFVALLGHRVDGPRSGLLAGVGYGAGWWLLGPLTLMPLMMGMGAKGVAASWSLAGLTGALPSLMGHMVYGAILGSLYGLLLRRGLTRRAEGRAVAA